MELVNTPDKNFSLDELASLSGIARRTIRYYIELGLVDRPVGETRAAYYCWRHLQQLLAVRRLTEDGLSLEAVRRQLAERSGAEGATPSPVTPSIAVRSHLQLAPGVELVIDPETARLSSEQLRRLLREMHAALEQLQQEPRS